MTRPRADISRAAPRRPLWPDLLLVAVPAGLLILALFLWAASAAKADTLVQMPPAKWRGCKPTGPVEIRRHNGTVNCGGVTAPSCARRRGRAWTIDLQDSGDRCVTAKMLIHEMAHTCGWNHQGMRMERCP